MTEPQGHIDFFISYRGARTDWARWINWVVRSAGYSTVLMDEFPTGTDWTDQMREACQKCCRLIPLYSTDYWDSGACRREFDTYLRHHMKNGKARFILPLETEACTVPDMDAILITTRLQKLTRDAAYTAINSVLKGITPVSTLVFREAEPDFPGSKSAASSSPATATLTWPPRCDTFVPNMANRHEEFKFFSDTLCGSTPERATLVCAETDHGKTKLVAEFHRYGCKVLGQHACAHIDFKTCGTVDHLWDTLSLDLGAHLSGLNDRSPVRLREGLRNASEPFLVVFDTFESAIEDVRRFVEGYFLADLGRTSAMRLLLAGQPKGVPDPSKSPWKAHAKLFNLGNMPDPQPWVDWAKVEYPHIPSSSVITIVASTGGVPGAIAKQLESLGKFSATQLKALGL